MWTLKIKKIVKEKIKKVWRAPLRYKMKKKLKNNEFSIISSNCVGRILSHDCGQRFRSPTINLIIPDFIDFCENLKYYIELVPTPDYPTEKENYRVCKVGDLPIIGVHYSSLEHLITDWTRRASRVNFNNIFLMATDNFLPTDEAFLRFDKLPYPKVCFTSNKNCKYDWQVFLPEFENQPYVGDILRYTDIFGTRIFEKHFDCVKWLNENESVDNKS